MKTVCVCSTLYVQILWAVSLMILGVGGGERRGEEDRDRECYSKVVCENSVTVLLLM